jgi:hypothetical protein
VLAAVCLQYEKPVQQPVRWLFRIRLLPVDRDLYREGCGGLCAKSPSHNRPSMRRI